MGEREREPRNGAKEFLQGSSFRPVPGLVNWLRGPTAHAVGYVVSPPGLGALVAAMPLCGAANPGAISRKASACAAAVACFLVRPYAVTPGRAGMSASQRPSSSRQYSGASENLLAGGAFGMPLSSHQTRMRGSGFGCGRTALAQK